MFTSVFFATVLAAVAVRADPSPNVPGPGDVYNEGSTCNIAWDADTTGTWTTMNIELMTGDNFNMIHLTTVATLDGTTKTTFDYSCPEVTPNSAIYFYQFTSPNSSTTLWTTRFAIADASGTTTAPANSTQPNTGAAIPWGVGALVDPSQATPAPTKGTSASTNSTSSAVVSVTSGATVATTSGTAALTSGSSSKASSSIVSVPTSKTSSSASAANTSNTTTTSAAAALSFDSRLTQIVGTLGVVAAAFAVLL